MRLAQGKQVGRLFPDMAAPAQGGLGGSQSSLECLTLRRAFAQTEIEYGTHGSRTVGRK